MIAAAAHPKPCSGETRNCSFWNWGAGNVRPHCCTDHLLELIDHVHAVLDRHGIRHWVDFGTLLGAVRDETLVPWDDGADLGILAADAPSVVALREELEAPGHVLFAHPGTVGIHYSAVNHTALDLTVWHERDGLVRVNADHERVAEPARALEELDVARVEEVADHVRVHAGHATPPSAGSSGRRRLRRDLRPASSALKRYGA